MYTLRIHSNHLHIHLFLYTITHYFLASLALTKLTKLTNLHMLSNDRRQLEYADAFDVCLWAYDQKFDEYIENLSTRLCKKNTKLNKLKEITIFNHLKVLVLNLWCVWIKDKTKFVFISRDLNFYSNLVKRYNPNKISFKNVVVMDALLESKFIELKVGQYRAKLKRRTRIRATQKLINEITKKNKFKPTAIQFARNAECIILREKDADDQKKKNAPLRLAHSPLRAVTCS